MIYPSKKEFVKLSKKGNIIPVYTEISADYSTPISCFKQIDKTDYSYILESAESGQRLGRYTFLGSDPSMVIQTKGRNIHIWKDKDVRSFITEKDPIEEIKQIMKSYSYVKASGLPRFCGGLVGYIGYDMVRFFEKIPDKCPDDLHLPDSVFILTDTMLIFDHTERTIKILSNALIEKDPATAYTVSVKKIEKIKRMLQKSSVQNKSRKKKVKSRITSNMTKKQFTEMVKKAKKYIRKGDIIQTVLSQRLEKKIGCDTFEIYKALRRINPSPYMFYLKLGGMKLIGSSPEIMVHTEHNNVQLRPIAGTRPRGKDEAHDKKLIKELLNDPKEKAEHIMLVDLGRNDMGRVCEYKSIKIDELMQIEKYSHVMHIVSNVIGKLKRGKDIYDVVKATFPAGTVSGAPKIRAMEIIDELEKTRRGPYAGAVGYFSFSGNEDFCITIRTILVKSNTAYIQAGAGIVADSNPVKEYYETLNKAKALLKAIELAEKGTD